MQTTQRFSASLHLKIYKIKNYHKQNSCRILLWTEYLKCDIIRHLLNKERGK